MKREELEAIAREALDMIPPHDTPLVAKIALARRWPELADNLRALALIDPVAHDVSCGVAAEYLRHNEAMPDKLREFARRVLAGISPRPTRKGASPLKNVWRNAMIKAAVDLVANKGRIHPTRNADSSTLSACDVVAGMLHKSYETIHEIYDKPLLRK